MAINGQERPIYAYTPLSLCKEIMDFFQLDPEMTANDHALIAWRLKENKSPLEILQEISEHRQLSLIRVLGTNTHPILEEWSKMDEALRLALKESAQIPIEHYRMVIEDYQAGRIEWLSEGPIETYQERRAKLEEFQQKLFQTASTQSPERRGLN